MCSTCGSLTQFRRYRGGIVRTGSKNEVGITAAFPVTINTAIVSPIARPIPNTTADVIPDME